MTFGIETREDAIEILKCFAGHAYMNGKFQAWSEGPEAWADQLDGMTDSEAVSIGRLFAKYQLQKGE